MTNGLFQGCLEAVWLMNAYQTALWTAVFSTVMYTLEGEQFMWSSFGSIDPFFNGGCSPDLLSHAGIIKMQAPGFQTQSVFKISISWQDLGWKLVFLSKHCNHISWLVWPQSSVFGKGCVAGCWHHCITCLPSDVNSIPLTVLPK